MRPHGAFHPSGISLFALPGSASRLFVINRRSSTSSTVEVFDVDQGRLVHLKTIRDERHLISPNDLVAISPEQFYLTNDHGFSSVLLQGIENLLHRMPHLRFGAIAYFDGQRFTTVARDIAFPNGIAVDQAAGRLYVASVLGECLRYADWDQAKPQRELSFNGEIPLTGAPDNIEWDSLGNLWVGVHQHFSMLSGYTLGLLPTSPSRVVCISALKLREPRVEEIWSDDGNRLSSSSVAAVYQHADGRKLLLIGAAFDDHLLIGEL